MTKPDDPSAFSLRDRLIGLDERSIRKSRSPELQRKIDEMERFRALLDQSSDAVFLLALPEGRVVDANLTASARLRTTRDNLLGKRFEDLLVTAKLPTLDEPPDRRPSLESICRASNIRADLLRADEGRFQVEMAVSMAPFADSNYAVVSARDVSERVRAEEELHARAAAMEAAMDGMAVISRDGLFLFVNQAQAAIYGYADGSEMVGSSWKRLYGERERLRFEQEILPELFRVGRWRGEAMGMKKGEEPFHQEISLSVADDDSIVAVTRDITGRKRAEAQIARLAFRDALTGLPNRSLFLDRLALAMARSRRGEGSPFAVLLIDLDRFKVVNDSLGHSAGDDVLRAMAFRLRGCSRQGDTVARLGGDEFAVLLESVASIIEIGHIIGRIEEALSQPVVIGEHEIFLTTSIGVVVDVNEYDHPESIVRDADIAMYRAKSQGRARHEIFDGRMREQAQAALRLETDLRQAIRRREFILHYQPIVRMEDGSIAGLEALIRWNHPLRGLVPPGEFIPFAEECGLIGPLGFIALRQACGQMSRWNNLFPELGAYVSVNLSGRQFNQPDLDRNIERILRATDLDPRLLRLEITESVVMEDPERAVAMLQRLRRLGTGVAIDDFGAGYSSLSYLRDLPADILKIDKSFVSGAAAKSAAAQAAQAGRPCEAGLEIAEIIVYLANTLGKSVIAEGIETADQADKLRRLGCRYGQGFHFSRPLDKKSAEEFLTAEAKRLAARPAEGLAADQAAKSTANQT